MLYLVYEIKSTANQEIASSFISQLQKVDLPLDQFLDGLGAHLSAIGADEAAVHVERAARVLRSTNNPYNK